MSSKLTLDCLNKLVNDLSYEDEQLHIKNIIKKETDKNKLYYIIVYDEDNIEFQNTQIIHDNEFQKLILIHASNEKEAIYKYIHDDKNLKNISRQLWKEKIDNPHSICCMCELEFNFWTNEIYDHIITHSKEEIVNCCIQRKVFQILKNKDIII